MADQASISGLAWLLDGEEIDIALYVAGVFPHGGADTLSTREAFDHAMQAIPPVAPLVEAARSGMGRFSFISSAMARIGAVEDSRGWVYCASKAALNMAVASAQHDYPRAILVAMSPGWVQTDMGGAVASLTEAQSVTAMRAALAGSSLNTRAPSSITTVCPLPRGEVTPS